MGEGCLSNIIKPFMKPAIDENYGTKGQAFYDIVVVLQTDNLLLYDKRYILVIMCEHSFSNSNPRSTVQFICI